MQELCLCASLQKSEHAKEGMVWCPGREIRSLQKQECMVCVVFITDLLHDFILYSQGIARKQEQTKDFVDAT